jgi:two-component system NtrC family response regulator
MEYVPAQGASVLIVDDDQRLLLSLKAMMVSAGVLEPALLSDGRLAMEYMRKHRFTLVLLDLLLPHINGMDILQQLKENFPATECIVITAIDDTSRAVQAMRFGAYDYLVKPLQREKLLIAIGNALERYSLKRELEVYTRPQSFGDLRHPDAFGMMVAEDEAMAKVFHQAEMAADTEYNVLITGETGSGKEMIARIIHNLSQRSKGPFVGINMAALSKNLFEDELFGHEKGAYTGAVNAKKGFFETAQTGTLFLDEIAELNPEAQGKLLRVIEERELYRVGSTKVKFVDLRVVAATNRNLRNEIQAGRFREDLFHRINRFPVHIPPLRERRKDILPLANHFLKIHSSKNHKSVTSLSPALVEHLMSYSYPGNVRELENMILSGVIAETGEVLRLQSLSLTSSPAHPVINEEELMMPLAELEKRHVKRVLRQTDGNRAKAAKILGIGLRTLQRKLKSFGQDD